MFFGDGAQRHVQQERQVGSSMKANFTNLFIRLFISKCIYLYVTHICNNVNRR